MSPSSSRKPLIRSNSDRPTMRNWPLFVFLFGLVFFFYLFYVYQAQSTELSILREQLESQVQIGKNVKSQLIDAKAEIEKFKNQLEETQKAKEEAATRFEECTVSLRNSKLKLDEVNISDRKLSDSVRDKEEHIEELRKNVAEMKRNNTALQSLLNEQTKLYLEQKEMATSLQLQMNALKVAATTRAAQPNLGDVLAPKENETVNKLAPAANPLLDNNNNNNKENSDNNAESKVEEAVPQIDVPIGPGDRVKMDMKNEKLQDSQPIMRGDYEDKKDIPPPDGPQETNDQL